MGLKRSNLTALIDFPNVIRRNGSNPDDETSHFAEVWTKKYPSLKRFFSRADSYEQTRIFGTALLYLS